MAAASVMIPISAINGTLPPSALVQHSPRHGRSRAASIKGKNRYNVTENRDGAIIKAVSFVLKRAVRQSDLDEESEESDDEESDEESDRLVSTDDGWVVLSELLQHSRITDLRVTQPDVVRIGANAAKARFELRQQAGAYQIRDTHKRRDSQLAEPILEGEPLEAGAADLPEYVVYETSYEAYPHILASNGIQRVAGASHITFSPIAAVDGSETTRPAGRTSDADVGIWVHLRSALEAEPSIVWQRTASGAVVTTATEVPRSLWRRAVARRQDIGLLLEDGEVRKEVPEALRGKGSKGKAKKGKGSLRKSRGGEDASGSASDE